MPKLLIHSKGPKVTMMSIPLGGKKTKRPNGEKVPNVPKVFKVSTIPKISNYL